MGTNFFNSAVEPSVAADPLNSNHLIGVWHQDRWSTGVATGIITGVSFDHGQTWTTATIIAADSDIGVLNLKTQQRIRVGGFPTVAVDRASGAVYMAWADARFSGNQHDGIVVSRSLDGGSSWSAPMQVNQVPSVQAFTPSIAVGGGGVAITYYDFRKDTENVNRLLANCWQIVSQDGGNSWRETPVAGPFDLLAGPRNPGAGGYFLADYQALTASVPKVKQLGTHVAICDGIGRCPVC